MKVHNKIENNTVGLYLELSNAEVRNLAGAMGSFYTGTLDTNERVAYEGVLHQLNLHLSQLPMGPEIIANFEDKK